MMSDKSNTGTQMQHVSSKSCPYMYFKIRLTLQDGTEEWTPTLFKYTVMDAMKETLGQVGASTSIDVLKIWPHGSAILRVPSEMSREVWGALTLYGKTPSGFQCAFIVEKATPFLMALSFDSKQGLRTGKGSQ